MEIDGVVRDMGEVILKSRASPAVISLYDEIRAMAGSFIPNLFFRVTNTIDYVEEPKGRDIWQTPEETLGGTGDCEDFTILLASVALKAEIPTRLRVTVTPGKTYFNHIYPLFYDGGEWIVADATPRNPELGREGMYDRERTYGINGGTYLIGEQLGLGRGSYLSYLMAFSIGIFLVIAIIPWSRK